VITFTKKRQLRGLKELTLFGAQLEWTGQVKYLGIILDKELTWKAHLESKVGKAYKIFNVCRRTYGKTWGLQPRILYWIYSMMVIPLLTYGSIVWWPRTSLDTCRRTLTTLQRYACMAITGAFRTTPTRAMESILGLKPLHLVIETEARKALYRLSMTGLWDKSKPGTKHSRMETTPKLQGILDMRCDKMSTRLVFKRNFKVYIPSRDEWRLGFQPKEENSLIWYTDGSKMSSGTGAGIYSGDCSVSISLGHYATVFQAEASAILICAQELVSRNTRGRTVYILSDSQAVLKALCAYGVDSTLILDCIHKLNLLGRWNRVRLVWVPGHVGVEGNEKADMLARQGSESLFVGPEPVLKLPYISVIQAINNFANDRLSEEWKSIPGLKHSKRFIKDTKEGQNRNIWGHGREHIRVLTGILTGHYGVNKILFKMGLVEDDKCRFCSQYEESMEHLLCDCDALARNRFITLGKGYPTPEDYVLLSKGSSTSYLRSILG
jgi:ribonuclease HI